MNIKRNYALPVLILSVGFSTTAFASMYDDGSDYYSPQEYQSSSSANDYYDDNGSYDRNDGYYQDESRSMRSRSYANQFDDSYQDDRYIDQYQYQDQDNYQDEPRRPTKQKPTHVAQKYDTADQDEAIDNEVSGSPYATSSSPLPAHITASLEKVIIVDPRKHAWGAYNPEGKLVRWGIATAGSSWCKDLGRACRTKPGTFRMYSLGDESCYSKRYPLPEGGAPMPYCMYFNGNEAIHGSNEVVYGNVSHGCVRVHVGDAEWLRYQFVEAPNSGNRYRGTKVVIKPY